MPRMTIEFSDKVNDILTELSSKEEVSKAEILRRALALYNYVQKEAVDKNKKVSITDNDDTILKDIIFS
ncbi:MAG: ribbon-helix-helix protein, CopG family [Candidatus Tectimicrobiota bacterium]